MGVDLQLIDLQDRCDKSLLKLFLYKECRKATAVLITYGHWWGGGSSPFV